jgi:molybdenum cofactor cytidylyltransferase
MPGSPLHPHALVLAAGAGSRFGGGKLVAPFGAGVLLDGAFAERSGQASRLVLVHAADHAEGLSASLRAGLAALPPEADGAFVFLGDMPRVPSALARRLAGALGDRSAAAPVFEGRRGHPVLIARALFAELMALSGDRGAGPVLAALGDRLALVETDDSGVLFDVDRPGDLPP